MARVRGDSDGETHDELGPDADAALDRDRPAEQVDEPFYDVEPEADPAEAARRGGVDLAKHLEDDGQVGRRDPDARVAHLDREPIRRRARADLDVAARRELERVSREV